MLIHPVIRIAGFLVFASFVALGDYAVLSLATALFAGVCLALRRWPSRAAWRMISRLRWLFVSLMIVYLAFTPGAPMFGLAWMPSVEGLTLGGTRIAALLLLIVAANLLLETTTRVQLLEALYWWARPLAWLGVSRERFAVRVTLTLEAVTSVQTVVAAKLGSGATQDGRLARLANVVGEAYQAVLIQAEQANLAPVEIRTGVAPPLHQWLVPIALIVVFAFSLQW